MSYQEPEERAQELLAESERLMREVELAIDETDRLYQSQGIKRGDLGEAIRSASERLTPAEKADIERQEQEWRDEVQRDVEQALQQGGAEPKNPSKTKKMRPGIVRI
jgi:ElaB/YqjD/DUF883 family membrane-anchored ribosome-binding protein